MKIESFFNRNYSSVERYWWKVDHRYSTDPEDHRTSLVTRGVLREAVSRLPGTALDVGGGEGSDAIRLAQLGWSVDLIDISGIAIEKSQAFVAALGGDVRCSREDASDFQPRRKYNIIVANGSLHYIRDKQGIIDKMQAATVPGGINAISLWSDFSPVPQEHQVVPTFPDAEDGVVVQGYDGWNIELLYYERDRIESAHDEMSSHRHSYIKMIARKPFPRQ